MSTPELDNQAPAANALPRRNWVLWVALSVLLLLLLGTLAWLAGRYEISRQQSQLEVEVANAASTLRSQLNRNLQSLQSLQSGDPSPEAWSVEATGWMREHRELLRLEWRDTGLALLAHVDSRYGGDTFVRMGRDRVMADVAVACSSAARTDGASYSSSYFLPTGEGRGEEVMELCMPVVREGLTAGFVVASYSMRQLLVEVLGAQPAGQQVSFTEADGTRLALHGDGPRGLRPFSAQQLLDLPGNTAVLRLDRSRSVPELFPNVLTALVSALALALLAVLWLMARDARRRLRAETELAEALGFRKAMEDSLVTGLRARDLQGRVTYVNPAFCDMVGFSTEELMQQHTQPPYWPPEMVSEYQRRLAIRLAGTVPPREGFESTFMRRDGTRFPVLVIEAPLIDAQGQQTGWMSAFLDISEQRRMEQQSRAAQEQLQATSRLAAVGEMASLLSHELNQPLAAIASYASGSLNLLSHSQVPSEDLRQAMQRIAEQADRAGKVIRSVHDFVRRHDQQREAVPAAQLIDGVMPLVTLQANKFNVRIRLDVHADVPPVWCERTLVEQVLLNLARNGIQAMEHTEPALRELRLEVSQSVLPGGEADSSWVLFSVSDNGQGIAPDVESRLFTPFFTTKPQGLGLGLSLCRTVIEQHGGMLRHGPRGSEPAAGAQFWFTLPAAH